jgi:hypothetical protein
VPTAEQRDWVEKTLGVDAVRFAAALPGADDDEDPGGLFDKLRALAQRRKKGNGADAATTTTATPTTSATTTASVTVAPTATATRSPPINPTATSSQTPTATPQATPASPPVPQHKVLGSAQTARAQKRLDALSESDKTKYEALLDGKPEKEKQYITKALAAGHTVAELEAFAAKIDGKDDTWMQDNLSLTGNSRGRGVQQQWSHSCNATTVEAVHGELDPVYALKVHEDNPNFDEVDASNAEAKNPNLAADQKAKLTSTYHGSAARDHSGVAANRDSGRSGRGRWASDLLNEMSALTGVTFDTKKIGTAATTADAIRTIDENTATGMPVPIVIGNAQGKYTHYVLVTASDAGPPKQYSIHDPWSGNTVIRTEDQIKDGTLNIAGSNQITAFEKPVPVPAS